jgi:DNA-binding Lrp family transcriptional regulator
MEKDRIEMSQRERDVLKVMSAVLKGERTQVEAARLLGKSERQVRRIQRKLEAHGDAAVVHGLRGRRSNRALSAAVQREALVLYRSSYAGFGPTLAAEKLAEDHEVSISVETLRQWLLSAGLWSRKRHRDRHRQRRLRKECFGEMVQADASQHDWLEGRGPVLTLVGMIDDATSKAVARFCESETTEAYMEVLECWLRKHGRPVSWYSDHHGIFRAESRLPGREVVSVPTQFSRALEELGIELILANSPQAKGRIERLWGTAQDRLVKELRLARASTIEQANRVLEEKFLPWFNRHCTMKPQSRNDAHRPLGPAHDLAAILAHQEPRTVANDYTIQYEGRVYQLHKPVWPGQRGGQVIVECRRDGSMQVRFRGRYLSFQPMAEKKQETEGMGAPPPNPRSLSHEPIPADAQAKGRVAKTTRPSAVHRAAGRSGRTSALPCPPNGRSCGSSKAAWRPGPQHAWRKSFLRRVAKQPDISTLEN